jgi:hypothetical protein
MAINVLTEQTVTLTQAAKLLPRLRGDRKVHVSTLHRWIKRGVRGVRLESAKIGRTCVTSREAIQRFVDRSSGAPVAAAAAPAVSERIEAELDRHGL